MNELDDIDGEAAEYVLGTLSREDRLAVAERRAADAALDRAIMAWERRLAPLAETVTPVAPSPHLYSKIRAQIGLAQHVVSLKSREQMLARRANRWRNAFAGVSALAACAIGILGYREYQHQQAPTQYVAVLHTGNDMPAFLMTIDTKSHNCVITAVNAPSQPDKIYEVWMVHDKLPKPKSLGVMNEGEMSVMPVRPGPDTDMFMNASFAVSVEPMGGSPTGAPTGPVLFTGKLVQATP